MINYASTDRSVEIIERICPHWEIIDAPFKWYEPKTNDKFIADLELRFNGWKMVLNTTEFLFLDDLSRYIWGLCKNVIGVLTNGLIVVDAPEEKGVFAVEKSLCLQKHYGYFEEDVKTRHSVMGDSIYRQRLLHRADHGHLTPGGHSTTLKDVIWDEHLYLKWFGWSPFCEEFKRRKIQIQHKMPPKLQEEAWFIEQKMVDDEKLERMYAKEVARSYDFRQYDYYNSMCERVKTQNDQNKSSNKISRRAVLHD